MGKIHDRLMKNAAFKHKRERRHRQVESLHSAMPTLERLVAVLNDRKQIMDTWIDLEDRHFRMQKLADEAKALGIKGRWNLLCNRTQCLSEHARWYNRGSYAFYCEECAHELNHANRNDPFCAGVPLCREITDAHEASTLHVSA